MLRVYHSGPRGGGHPMIFLTHPSKLTSPMGSPKNNCPLKSKAPFQEMILEKKAPKHQKLSSILVTVSLIKQHWKKMTDIPQKRDFHT